MPAQRRRRRRWAPRLRQLAALGALLAASCAAPAPARADDEVGGLADAVAGGGLGAMALLSGLSATLEIVLLNTRPPEGQVRPARALGVLLALGYAAGGISLAAGSIALGVGLHGHGRGWAVLGGLNMGFGLASIVGSAICQARCEREVVVAPLIERAGGGLSVAWRF